MKLKIHRYRLNIETDSPITSEGQLLRKTFMNGGYDLDKVNEALRYLGLPELSSEDFTYVPETVVYESFGRLDGHKLSEIVRNNFPGNSKLLNYDEL